MIFQGIMRSKMHFSDTMKPLYEPHSAHLTLNRKSIMANGTVFHKHVNDCLQSTVSAFEWI